MGRKLFPSRKGEPKDKSEQPKAGDDKVTNNFDTDSEPSLDITCNVVLVLPREYDQVMKVEEPEDTTEVEMARHKPICYYVMSNGYVKEQNAFFKRPDEAMKNHLKLIFIRGKVENVGINKILVNGRAIVNLMPHFMLKKVGKDKTDTKPHNMVMSNYEGKVGTTMGVIQVDLTICTITRLTMFMVIVSKANYNLLLDREWIHGVGVVPYLLHQRILIWRSDGIVENIEAGQRYYMDEVNFVDMRHFDKHLENIAPCASVGFDFTPTDEAFCSR